MAEKMAMASFTYSSAHNCCEYAIIEDFGGMSNDAFNSYMASLDKENGKSFQAFVERLSKLFSPLKTA